MTTLQDTIPLPLRSAMEARDLAAAVEAFAPNAVLHSPITGKLRFEGRGQIAALLRVVLDVFDEFSYTDEFRSAQGAILIAKAKLGSTEVELVDHIRLGPDGKIIEMTVFFRPMPAIAVALRSLGVGLARRKSRTRAALVSALSGPLVFLTRAGDGIGVRLIRPTL